MFESEINEEIRRLEKEAFEIISVELSRIKTLTGEQNAAVIFYSIKK